MIRPSALAIAAALALSGGLSACATTLATQAAGPQIPTQVQYVADAHSHARPEIARVHHVDLNLMADFDRRMLAGTASLDITAEQGANEIILDIRDLDIHGVSSDDGPLDYTIGEESPFMGKPLVIAIPFTEGRIHIDYSTRPDAAALQWLTPEQTAGGRLPYLFSQGQAILTRTWIPTQDSPGIRQTYSARISVPEGMTAVMSAEMLTPQGEPDPRGRAFRFRLDNPVPPYLIAIGVGDIAFQPLGARTGVYTEPSMLQRSAAEFPEVEAMVEAAEDLYGPYIWGRYDMLVLPPSFPFGGMENPRLTFATPTIIAGDRSLVSLVAHELAHSWSGNLVTNATWDDFWLNEGFTVYFENRIMEAIYGPERAEMLRALEWTDLQAALAELPEADQSLHLELAGRDPDEGMTSIAYDKGAFFLRTIERTVSRDRFDGWLRGYFDRNAYRPMTTAMFLADIREHLIAGDAALEAELQMDAWIYRPGLPSNAVQPASNAFTEVEAQVQAFVNGTPAAQLNTGDWVTQEWQHFLGSLPGTMTDAQLADLDNAFGLSQAGNSEILFGWLMIAVRHQYDPAVPALEQFLTGMGRRKFTQPLYVALMAEGDWGRPLAQRIYEEARPGYHPITTGSADPVVRGQ
ncbi:MAG: M1 family metallopeptidase [Brevundimonas sp.]|uniref:M1 family metallopeptidase n=1 Tax=Brevundimonas sp. TaxID=1871086 RepID=UPI00391DFDC1